ncbi:MAG: hypothetical protein ACXVAB_08885 [Thermodesulfobacteriota bacterium]
MKKIFGGMQIFLIIAVSFFILGLPAYLDYTQMSQIKFVTSDLSFENPGQEEGLADSEKESKVDRSKAFLIMLLLCSTNLFEDSTYFSQALSLQERIIVLRC